VIVTGVPPLELPDPGATPARTGLGGVISSAAGSRLRSPSGFVAIKSTCPGGAPAGTVTWKDTADVIHAIGTMSSDGSPASREEPGVSPAPRTLRVCV